MYLTDKSDLVDHIERYTKNFEFIDFLFEMYMQEKNEWRIDHFSRHGTYFYSIQIGSIASFMRRVAVIVVEAAKHKMYRWMDDWMM